MAEVLKNLEFLELTELGKDLILNFHQWHQKYREKQGCDPFCGRCEYIFECPYHRQNPVRTAGAKLIFILNQIYWEAADLIPDGQSIPLIEFIPQVFSKYFTLPEAINAIVGNFSGAPICGLSRLINDLTSNYTFFEIKMCSVCDRLTGKNHYWDCRICQEKSCQIDYCYDCRNDYCQKCITVIDKPIPESYVGQHYGQCSQCREKWEDLRKIMPELVVKRIGEYPIGDFIPR